MLFSMAAAPPWPAHAAVADITKQYTPGRKLGAGANGIVFEATRIAKKQLVAIKVYKKGNLPAKELEDLQTEIALLRRLSHPHLVGFIEMLHDAAHVYLVLEHLSGGDLFDVLHDHGALDEGHARVTFAQCLLAVEYLHALAVVHRDIKAENVCFDGPFFSGGRAKLVDVGSSDTCDSQGLTGLVGTPQYCAPEIVTGFSELAGRLPTLEPYGKPCDLWSIGVVLFEMLSWTLPFKVCCWCW